jgi:hypothetical protein
MLICGLRVWVVAGLFASAAVVQGRAAASRLEIVVSVFNRAGVEQTSILDAEETAGKIYREARIVIHWRNCRTQTEPELEPCEQTVDRRQLVLNIEHQLQNLTTDAYGVAFLGDDGWGAFCDVSYHRILELHHVGRASEATILGIVVAHELGHLLLGLDAHSSTGIMRPQLQYQDFLTSEFATGFTRSQVQKICDRFRK